jgi:hypothetical protein
VGRPRCDRKTVIPDLAVAGVGVLDHMEGGGLRGARGGKGGSGNDSGSSNGMDVMIISLSIGWCSAGPAKIVFRGSLMCLSDRGDRPECP